MIPNLANTVLGLWLVYLTVLDPRRGTNWWVLALAGVVVLALARWAREKGRVLATHFGRYLRALGSALSATVNHARRCDQKMTMVLVRIVCDNCGRT